MERKTFTKFEIAVIKRTAQNVNPMVSRKAKIKEQINILDAEYERLSAMQEQYEASIRTLTGGYSTEELVDKVIETTNSVDKNGRPVKIAKYVLKYPDTVIPPENHETETSKEISSTEDNEVSIPQQSVPFIGGSK